MPTSDDLPWRLARFAHQLWCTRMIMQGWKPGRQFDAKALTHDALVEFDQLGPVDRRAAYAGIVAADVAAAIRGAIDYPRGEDGRDRELGLDDMEFGLRVQSVDDPQELG